MGKSFFVPLYRFLSLFGFGDEEKDKE